MDEYLASLVKKDQAEDVQAVVETDSEPEVIETTTELEVAEEVVSEPEVTSEPEAVSKPETKSEETVVVVNKEVWPETTPVEIVVNEKPESILTEGQIVNVSNIRVYKTPDTHQIGRSVSGNVTYLGKIGEFNIIGYMKHGFGIVKGYTPDQLVR